MYTHPSRVTAWKDGQRRLALPERTADGGILLRDIRDYAYADSAVPVERGYRDETFDPAGLARCSLYSIAFGPAELFAHVILSFRWRDGRTVCLSVEARRRPDEDYSVLRGLLPYYGLIYIWGTERDLLGLRLCGRRDRLVEHPLSLGAGACRRLFDGCLARTAALAGTPDVYGSFSNNCTTNVVRHLCDATGLPYPRRDWRVVLSGRLAGYLRDAGLSTDERVIEPFSAVRDGRPLDADAFARKLRGEAA